MGLVEVELERMLFQNLVLFLTRQSPIPDPTFEVLGADRLVRRFVCGDGRGDVHVGEAAPDIPTPPGVVPVRADLVLGHASVAEIEADAGAETVTPATGWLHVALERQTYGPAKGRHALTVRLLRIDVPGRPPTAAFDQPASPRFGRPPLAVLPLPLPGTVKDVPITGAALFLSDQAATARLATAGQDIYTPRQDRIVGLEKSWVIRLSPEIFTDMLHAQMQKAVTPPPGGTELIAAPTTSWTATQILRPLNPQAAPSGWGVEGSLRLRKRNACGLIAKADVSVTVHTTLLPVPDVIGGKVTFWLQITVNADDGTTFKCWLAEGGPVLTAFFAGAPLLALAVTLGSLAIVGGVLDDEVKDAATAQDPGSDFTQVEAGDNYTIHTTTLDLDLAGLSDLLVLDHAATGPDGLVIGGPAGPKAPFIGLIGHSPQFTPTAGPLRGAWASGYSCGKGWRASFDLPRVHITDPITTPDGTPVPGSDGKPLRVPVAVFPTSYVVPTQHWTIDTPPTVEDQYVSVTGDIWSYVGPHGTAFINTRSHFVLHTSAGLRRYDIGHVPEPPEPPTTAQLVILKGNCEMLVHERNDVHWLVDPPEYDYGHEALRHWRVVVDAIAGQDTEATPADGGSITVESVHADGRIDQLATFDSTALTATELAVEALTDQETHLRIAHDLGADNPIRAQIVQQWLLPTATAPLNGAPAELTVDGDNVHVAHRPTVFALSTGLPVSDGPARTPKAIDLPDGRIAAVHNGHLIIGEAFGGAAVRTEPTAG